MKVGFVFSPLDSLKQRLTRRRRIRSVLHLLSASGVLRPSHVELRYAATISRKRLGLEQPILPRRDRPASFHRAA